jgi:hypothetical protein
MKEKYKYFYSKLLFVVLVTVFMSCRKDKVQEPVFEEPTKWELISGYYKVYDTLGEYLYNMEIKHKRVELESGHIRDSLEFINFDNDFTFTFNQPNFSNIPMKVHIGVHDTLWDKDNNRWRLFSGNMDEYNFWVNDTIKLRFNKTNINYYLQDLVPYYECDCKQIAVKQN